MARSREETNQARAEALRLLMGENAADDSRVYAESQAWRLVDRVGWGFEDQEDSDEELLAALTLVDLLREQVDAAEARLLRKLRREEDPVHWTRIAEAMGITRQGAERRLLRATSSMSRNADEGRQALARRMEMRAKQKQRAVARWGSSDPAGRDWHLRVRVRAIDSEMVGTIRGYAGAFPDLSTVHTKEGMRVYYLAHTTVLEVLEETTPWKGVQAPANPLAGLTTE